MPPAADADLAPLGNFPGPEDIDRNGNGVLDSGAWQQTSTIEGTKVIDAWVKAGEPAFFAEFGPPGFHVFIGFVKEFDTIPAPTGTSATISGTVVNQHLSRPPDYAFYNGSCFGHTTPWVGLNSMAGGIPGQGLYAAPTDENCGFSIQNVPDGSYQLVAWDNNLDLIFAFKGITITNGGCSTPSGSCNLGLVPVFQWFHRQEHRAFDDLNANGMWDSDEGPTALETGFNLRWRDGTIYQGNVSDGAGAFTFDQVFPFFSWLVAEVDFVRNQATGVTVVVDNGGAIPVSVTWTRTFRRQRSSPSAGRLPRRIRPTRLIPTASIPPSVPSTPITVSISARSSRTASRASSARPMRFSGASAITRTARTAASRASCSTR